MPNRKVFKSVRPNSVAVVPFDTNAGLDGYKYIGEYHHELGQDTVGNPINHVMYQHVQDLLYKDGVLDAMNYPINIIQNSAIPPEPGPMDFSSDALRANSYTTSYAMAHPNCILMVTGRKEPGTGLQGLRASHGGEPLTMTYYNHDNSTECWAAIFVGSNLTLEAANLIVEADEAITPLIGRIIDKGNPITNTEFVVNAINARNLAFKFGQLPEQKYLRVLVGYRGFKDFVQATGTEVDLLAYKRLLAGVERIPEATASAPTWSFTGTTATYTGGNEGANDTLTLTYPNGATNAKKFNAIQFRTTLSGGASMSIWFMAPNGASRIHTLMGPVTDQEVMIESSASGAYFHAIKIAANENCVLSDVKILSDSMSITAVMVASPDLVDMKTDGGNINMQFNNLGYTANIGMAYQEDI